MMEHKKPTRPKPETTEFKIHNPDNIPLYTDNLSTDFLRDGEIRFVKDVCNWCGEEHNDITFNVDPPLTVCVTCIIEALDKVLGNHSSNQTKIGEEEE